MYAQLNAEKEIALETGKKSQRQKKMMIQRQAERPRDEELKNIHNNLYLC